MKINQEKQGAKLTLNINGRLDTSTAPQLEEVIAKSLSGVEELVMDCKELEYVSSAGLRVLLQAQKKMSTGGSLKLVNVNEAIMEVFEITGFDSILTIE